ncbi:methyltransferase domain-containing protein [Undibacter mobilis]|uniref:Methyltransferase domain-containing protein n=1 Tax=Undibacter mobilis TaxID=2292256 RepID=A0A371B822_9BRAD|nr:methyltransferase domain-containing protein [Undibacter mobilis]RDV03682.1 methyltransferase domain-containing protein [Undibacter mobilis]
MSAIHQTSGDLIADRRFEWARGLIDAGDHAAAADLLAEVVTLAPGFAAAWFALGDTREKLGDQAGAVAAFEKARDADPRDTHGAAVRLARLARLGALPPVAMPIGYIQSLFDGYAPKFETSLTGHLNYRGPKLLLDALTRAGAPEMCDAVLDLGCGTGLAGDLFRPLCGRLTGVDLSGGMLAVARTKGVYDDLVEAEVMTYLRGAVSGSFDLVLAADVFIYFHELMQIGAPTARVLRPGGYLAFSVETHDGDGVILRDTLRYAHSEAHVRAAVASGGLELLICERASTRTEKGVPVPGLVVVAKR